MLVLNDIHVGVQRKGGTTPRSREKLRNFLFSSLQSTLSATDERELVINGDLFDDFEIDPRDWVQTYSIFAAWLSQGRKLYLVAGNHDHSAKALRVSSFQMLCEVLKGQFKDLVTVIGIDEYTALGQTKVIALAHCSNQDMFNLNLGKLLGSVVKGDILLLHANFDNNFAAQSDHSLNVTRQQAADFKTRGVTLVFAHEHQARASMGGSVVVLGNQWPTSIVDCLGNDKKFAHVIDSDNDITPIETWSRDGMSGYAEIDWRELTTLGGGNADFIRIVGQASANEASDVINSIAKFRTQSEAFVVTNAVKIEGMVEIADLPETFEATKAFDVMEFISRHLDAEEMVVVTGLIGA